jgi:hypothetical protein
MRRCSTVTPQAGCTLGFVKSMSPVRTVSMTPVRAGLAASESSELRRYFRDGHHDPAGSRCRIMARTTPRHSRFLPLVFIVWLIRSCRSWTTRIIQRQWRRKSFAPQRRLRPMRIADAGRASRSRGSSTLILLKASSSSPFTDGSWESPPLGGGGNSYDIALCIVPPDEVWDTLQRARHVTRDDSFTIWPPAIRLFHPVPDGLLDPLEVASVVERYRIEPFQVRLNQWAVIPHAEVLAAQLEAVRASRADSDPDADDSSPAARLGSEDDETRRAHFDALIQQEELLGRINKERRDRRALERGREQRREAEAKRSDETGVPWGMKEEEGDSEETEIMAEKEDSAGSSSSDDIGPEEPPSALSPREVLEKQQRMYEEFNGPCVVCLEPDTDSKARLVELRELLRQELFGNCTEFVDRYSPTATVAGPSSQSVYRRSNPISSSSSSSPGAQRRRDRPSPAAAATADAYRPLVPIGAFATVNEAIRMARKLRQLWNPLSFTVTDLQVVSMKGAEGEDWFSSPSSSSSSSAASPSGATDRSFAANPPQMGCDAMIMLVGQEVPVNDEESQEMTRLLCERGEPGGAARQASVGEGDETRTISSDGIDYSNNDDDNDGQYDDLLQFLDEDDVDEGTVVVIGRTHFFTGEMRHYVGMPAASTSENQAAISTTGSSGDTGTSRRKSSVTLSRLLEGEFGQVPPSDAADDGNGELGG